MLIGRDNMWAFKNSENKEPQNLQMKASKTPLGWVLIGPKREASLDVSGPNSTKHNIYMARCGELEHAHRRDPISKDKYYSLLNPGISKPRKKKGKSNTKTQRRQPMCELHSADTPASETPEPNQ